jgi:hypothetical protein
MNSCLFFRRLLMCAGLGASGLLFAQSASPAKNRPCQLITFFMMGDQELVGENDILEGPAQFKFSTDKETFEIAIRSGQMSDTFARKPDSKIFVFRLESSSEQSKPPKVIPVAEVHVDVAWRNVMILVYQNHSSGLVTLKALNQSMDNIPIGTVGFINLTKVNLAVKLASATGQVAPLGQVVLSTGLMGMEAAMVPVYVAAEIEGEGRLINSASYALSPNERRLALLYPGRIRPLQVLLLNPAPIDPP